MMNPSQRQVRLLRWMNFYHLLLKFTMQTFRYIQNNLRVTNNRACEWNWYDTVKKGKIHRAGSTYRRAAILPRVGDQYGFATGIDSEPTESTRSTCREQGIVKGGGLDRRSRHGGRFEHRDFIPRQRDWQPRGELDQTPFVGSG